MDCFRTSINLNGLKIEQHHENDTNTYFSKFGSSPTFTKFNENLDSEFVSQVCRNKGLFSSRHTWCRLLVEVGISAWFWKYRLKNSFTTICSCKKTTFGRFGSTLWTSTQNWVRLYICRLCSSICCSAMQSTSQWTCNSGASTALRT